MLFSLFFSILPSLPLIEERLEEVRKQSFPELHSLNIETRGMSSDEYFFATMVEGAHLPKSERRYLVLIGSRLSEGLPPQDALDGILAHELQHLVHYSEMNFFELAWLYIRYEILSDEDFIVNYERRTDQESMRRGYHEQLALYREWLYQQFSPEIVERKKSRYLRPNEIRAEKALTP